MHERDEIPACPNCKAGRFKRGSIFGEPTEIRLPRAAEADPPDWLDASRQALVQPGDYMAFEDEERPHVVPLQAGWTRVGRSLAAHMRFDDPTVSRRHALLHREEDGVRILDDRSLNGVFVNGERVEWRSLEDGDEVMIGRFRLYFISLAREASRGSGREVATPAS